MVDQWMLRSAEATAQYERARETLRRARADDAWRRQDAQLKELKARVAETAEALRKDRPAAKAEQRKPARESAA